MRPGGDEFVVETEFELTERQQEELLTAWEMGYFTSPKGTTLKEIGEELGVTDARSSQLFWIAMREIVADVVDELENQREPLLADGGDDGGAPRS